MDTLWYVRMCKLEIIYATDSCGPLEVVLVFGLDPLRGFGFELINNPRTDSRCNPLLARILGREGILGHKKKLKLETNCHTERSSDDDDCLYHHDKTDLVFVHVCDSIVAGFASPI